jgi:hypothetical protein
MLLKNVKCNYIRCIISSNHVWAKGDAPPNSLRDLNVGPWNEIMEKKDNWVTFLNSQHFVGRKVCRSFGMGLGPRMNSQASVQDEINMHNQEKKVVGAN